MQSEQLAQFIATHALLLFAGGMVIMTALTVALWYCLERYGERWWQWILHLSRLAVRGAVGFLPARKRLSGWRAIRFVQKNYLSIHALVGFAVVFFALSGFVEFADEIDEHEALSRFDNALASELGAHLQAQTYRFFAIITHLGDTLTITLLGSCIAAILCWRRERLLAIGWLTALIGNSLLNVSLKAFFQRTRPLHDHGFALADGWSFPSGHASGTLVAYGMLAYLALRNADSAWRLPIVLLAIAIIQLVGGSRIFLQVHYFSDVVAGFCSGAAWLAVCIAGTEIALRHRR